MSVEKPSILMLFFRFHGSLNHCGLNISTHDVQKGAGYETKENRTVLPYQKNYVLGIDRRAYSFDRSSIF